MRGRHDPNDHPIRTIKAVADEALERLPGPSLPLLRSCQAVVRPVPSLGIVPTSGQRHHPLFCPRARGR